MIKFGNTFVNVGGTYLTGYTKSINPNPLNLPANTIRAKFSYGHVPTMGDTQTLVNANENIWDIYKESNIWKELFKSCTDLLQVLGANTSNVTYMYGMFNGCRRLSSISLFDTSNVTNMYEMFKECVQLTSVPLFDTSNVTDMWGMFQSCLSLTTVPLFNTSNVTTMVYMFSLCNSLTSIPIFNTSKVTNMAYMFESCNSLTTVPLLNTSNVTNMYGMFIFCLNVQSGALALYQQASSQTNPPTEHRGTFGECGRNTQTGAAELAQIPSSWGGTGT